MRKRPSRDRAATTGERVRALDADPAPIAGEPETPARLWAAVALLVVAIGIAYANSFHGPFIFDDAPSIVENPSIRTLQFPEVLLAPPSALTTTGRPIVNLSLAVNYAIGGTAVEGYHVVNLALHLLAALLLFALVRRTLLLPSLSREFASVATELAFAVALLWGVHPLQTESVSYVVQRAEVLVGLFYLGTLYCVLRGATAARSGRWYAAAVGSCALGMASKEVMVSAPLVAVLFDRTFIAGSFKESLRRRSHLWLALAATWLLPIVLLQTTGNRDDSAGFGLGMTSWEYARSQFGFIVHYLRLTFWPHPLVLDYGRSIAHDAEEIVPYALLVLALVAATARGLVRQQKWAFLGACFFLILSPTSSIVPLPGQTASEHRMYLPLAALVTLLVLSTYRVSLRFGPGVRRATVALLAALAVALGARTYYRNRDYQSEFAIWNATVQHRPENDRAYLTRGSVYWTNGQREAALSDYERALTLNPQNPKAYVGRGNVHIDEGRYDQARWDYEKAIELSPKLADAYNGRGEVFAHEGQIDAAMKDFERAIELHPGLAQAHYDLAEAYSATGAIDAAIASYDRVIQLRPDYANAYNSRGSAYDSKGEVDDAIRDYGKAIALRPEFVEALSNRCSAYEVKRQLDAALQDCDKAIALRPTFAEAYSNRGNVLQAKGEFDAAIRDYDKAIELKADFAPAYQNRAMARTRTQAYDAAWADVRMFRKLGGTPAPMFVEDLTRRSGRSE
ncbi:MAG TPA: tetratricopeptide repeat protein [Polyangiaceae bacterium]|nr:tetratricopeptide repeat protein [Polyangiaceae bacterium]